MIAKLSLHGGTSPRNYDKFKDENYYIPVSYNMLNISS